MDVVTQNVIPSANFIMVLKSIDVSVFKYIFVNTNIISYMYVEYKFHFFRNAYIMPRNVQILTLEGICTALFIVQEHTTKQTNSLSSQICIESEKET